MHSSQERYRTREEAAEFVRLSKRTLAELARVGGGPAMCKIGRRVVYPETELVRWMANRVVSSTSEATLRRQRG
ncbi:helix-turn-helix transcriptional regulator [Teichococcus aestuarii]|uniref:helix-turn-helix transcriptional regulator n=1 Tax=Teichococcus aestuarii TaxID=568898 RepID=UPI003608F7F8